MQGIQESLAGRAAIVDMLGMSSKEIDGRAGESKPFLPSPELLKSSSRVRDMNQTELFSRIWKGAFPELIADSSIDKDTFYRGYVRSYIERDVKDFYGLKNDIAFHDFIRAAAARTGSLLNYTNLCKDTDIDIQTAKLWLGILERSGIIKLLEPYSPNITQRIIKTPKLYFLDTGLASYLTGWDTPESLMLGAQNGAMLETWAYTEILKSYWHNGKELNIFFYRDKEKNEIDFVIEKNMVLYPVEIKKTATPDNSDIKNIKVLSKFHKQVGTGALLCMQKEPIPLAENLISFPLWEV
jgi:predicted AAA+ superfamily ATPase